MRKILSALTALTIVALALVFGPAAVGTSAADHGDGPRFTLGGGNGDVDINDVYVFHPGAPGSQDLSRTVLVMTTHPAAGVLSGTAYRPNTGYDFQIDLNGNGKTDVVIQATFERPRRDGSQKVKISWAGPDGNFTIARGETNEILTGRGRARDAKAFAGLADDPFFFDLANFNNGATFCGAGLPVTDFFTGLNTNAIVVEVPTSWFSSSTIGIWGRTAGVNGGPQFDRMGRPAINTVFIPNNPFEPAGSEPSLKDKFNSGKPSNDQANFRSEVVDSLTLLYSLNDASDPNPGDDAATVQAITDILLPDLLTVDLSQETGFLNGRNLADDVIDAELALITEGLITSDCVPNGSTFLDAFPYVGVPNS